MSKMAVSLSELPDGWIWATVKEIAEFIRGVSYKKNESSKTIKEGYVPILRANNINRELNYTDLVYVPREKIKNEQFVKAFDIVVAMSSGSKNLVGKAAQSDEDYHGAFGTFCGLVRVSPQLDRRFIGFFFQSPGYRNEISHLSSGMNINNLRRQHIQSMCLPIPPLSEQHRIVAKLEELFTQLDTSINLLQEVQSQLKRYRQSVLKSAFEGKLTKAWRADHQNEIEPASVLLERILKERREKWKTEQLEQIKAKGKMPKDDKWKAKYKEPIAPDTSDLPELSNGWKWVKLGQITYLITKGSSPRWQGFNYVDKGICFLRSQNVGWGELDLSNIVHLPEAFNEKEKKSILKEGDVLFNLVGASIGRAAIASDELEGANMNQAVALIRLMKDGLDNKFLMNYLLSPEAQSIIHGKKVDVARANLSLTDVSEFAVPLPPLLEQQAIVAEVESRLSITDEVEKTIRVELKRTEQLRQSILKRTFSGELVPQEPNDKSASVLLEEIKAEKSQHIQE